MTRLEENLRKLSKPNLELPVYHRRFRQILQKKIERRSNSILNMAFNKLLPIGFAFTLVLILGFIFIPNKENSIITPVSAAEMIEGVMQKVKNMSPEELEHIKSTMNLPDDSSILALLEVAKNAPDLRIVPPKEITCKEAKTILAEVQIVGSAAFNRYIDFADKGLCINPRIWELGGDKYTPDEGNIVIKINNETITFLEFTQDGARAVIGIGKNGLPTESFYRSPVEGLSVSEKIIGNTFEKMIHLDPAQLQRIIEGLNIPDKTKFFNLLVEAQASEDLEMVKPKLLSCSEAQKIIQEMPEDIEKYENYSTMSSGVNCKSAEEWIFKTDQYSTKPFHLIMVSDEALEVTFLEYTKNGARKAIGINSENIIVATVDYTPGQKALHSYLIDLID